MTRNHAQIMPKQSIKILEFWLPLDFFRLPDYFESLLIGEYRRYADARVDIS